jgi:hypothetical protein
VSEIYTIIEQSLGWELRGASVCRASPGFVGQIKQVKVLGGLALNDVGVAHVVQLVSFR